MKIFFDTEYERVIVLSRNYSTKDNLLNKISNYVVLQSYLHRLKYYNIERTLQHGFFPKRSGIAVACNYSQNNYEKVIFIPAASMKKSLQKPKKYTISSFIILRDADQ